MTDRQAIACMIKRKSMYYDSTKLKDIEYFFDEYLRYFFRIATEPPEPWTTVNGFVVAMEWTHLVDGFEVLPRFRRALYRRYRIAQIRYLSNIYIRLNALTRPLSLSLFFFSVALTSRRSKLHACEAWKMYVDLLREMPSGEAVNKSTFYLKYVLFRVKHFDFDDWVSPREIIESTGECLSLIETSDV